MGTHSAGTKELSTDRVEIVDMDGENKMTKRRTRLSPCVFFVAASLALTFSAALLLLASSPRNAKTMPPGTSDAVQADKSHGRAARRDDDLTRDGPRDARRGVTREATRDARREDARERRLWRGGNKIADLMWRANLAVERLDVAAKVEDMILAAKMAKHIDSSEKTGTIVTKTRLPPGKDCVDANGKIRTHNETYPLGPGKCGDATCLAFVSSKYEITQTCHKITESEIPDPTNCRITNITDRAFPDCCPYIDCKENESVLTTVKPGLCFNSASLNACTIWRELKLCSTYKTWCQKTCNKC